MEENGLLKPKRADDGIKNFSTKLIINPFVEYEKK